MCLGLVLPLMACAWVTWWHCHISLHLSSQPEARDKSLYWKSASHLQTVPTWCWGKGFRERRPIGQCDWTCDGQNSVQRTLSSLNLSEVLPETLFCGHSFWIRTFLFQSQRDLGLFSHALSPIPSMSVTLETRKGNIIGNTLKEKKEVALQKRSEDSDLFHELRVNHLCYNPKHQSSGLFDIFPHWPQLHKHLNSAIFSIHLMWSSGKGDVFQDPRVPGTLSSISRCHLCWPYGTCFSKPLLQIKTQQILLRDLHCEWFVTAEVNRTCFLPLGNLQCSGEIEMSIDYYHWIWKVLERG